MQTTNTPKAGERTQDDFGDIFNQGAQAAETIVQGARQQFNGGTFNNHKCPYLPGSSMHREWINGVRSVEAKHNFITGI